MEFAMPLQDRPHPTKRGITGRDGYVMAKALGYAIATIKSLPAVHQELSDCDDMHDILCHLVPNAEARSRMADEIGKMLQTAPSL
jgi:hypothetical protein